MFERSGGDRELVLRVAEKIDMWIGTPTYGFDVLKSILGIPETKSIHEMDDNGLEKVKQLDSPHGYAVYKALKARKET